MASPFRAFRKHQKVWLALLGLMAMISFVFLPIALDRITARQGTSAVAATTTRYGNLSEEHLQTLRGNRGAMLRYVSEVRRELAQQGVQSYGFMPQPADEIERRLSATDDESLAVNWLLWQRAKEMGISVGDDAVKDLLQSIAQGTSVTPPAQGAKDSQYQFKKVDVKAKRLREIVGSLRVGQTQFVEIWRHQMMAWRVEDLFAESLPAMTPGQRWDYFLRTQRMATAEVMPVEVAQFVDATQDPGEAQLRDFFERHKDRLPDPESSEPGFKTPHRVRVQYLKVDREKFIKSIDPKSVTEEEIKQYYDQNKDFSFREIDAKPEAKPDASGDKRPAEKKDGAKPEPMAPGKGESVKSKPAEASKQAEEKKPEEKKPAPAKAEEKRPPEEKKDRDPKRGEAAKPEAKKEGAKPEAKTEDKKNADKPDTKTGEKKADEKKSSDVRPTSPFRFVALAAQEEKGKAGAAKPEKTPATAAEKAKPAEEQKRQPSAKPAERTEGKPADKSEPRPLEKPADKASAKPAEPPAPKYLPLEKVRDQIRDTLIQQKARTQIEQLLRGIQDSALGEYHQRWSTYRVAQETRKSKDIGEPPRPPDFKELAKRHPALSDGDTGLVSQWEIRQFEIAASSIPTRGMQFGRKSPFVDYVFQTLSEFKPAISETDRGDSYLFWKVEDVAQSVPKFEDEGVRDLVLSAWRFSAAREAARKKAQDLADEARKANKPLTDLFGTRPGSLVTRTDPFSWMTFRSIPTAFAGPQSEPALSEVKGVLAPGEDFMRTVFGLQPGEVGVAPNRPQSFFYVVRLASYAPSEDELWKSFREGRDMNVIQTLNFADQRQIYQAWRKDLMESAGLKWQGDRQRTQQQQTE